MKLFQAVKLIEDAGLTPELHSCSDGDVKVPLLLAAEHGLPVGLELAHDALDDQLGAERLHRAGLRTKPATRCCAEV